MKKSMLTLAALLLFAGSAFAAAIGDTTTYTAGDQTWGASPGISLKPSGNVKLAKNITDLGTAYTLGASHSSGSKTYGSSSSDTLIYMKDGTDQAIPAAATITWGAGWTTMK